MKRALRSVWLLAAVASTTACPIADAVSGFVSCGPDGWGTTRYPGTTYESPSPTQCDVVNYGIDACYSEAEWCWDDGEGPTVCDVHGENVDGSYHCVLADEAKTGPCADFINDVDGDRLGDVVLQWARFTSEPTPAGDTTPACHKVSFLVGGVDGPKSIEALRGTVRVVTNLRGDHVLAPDAILVDSVAQANPENATFYPTNVYRAQICVPTTDVGTITAVAIRIETDAIGSNPICATSGQ